MKIYGLNTVIAKMVSKWKHILFRLLKLTSWFAKGQRPRSLDHHLYSETTSGISILQMIILYLEVFQWNHRSCFLNLRPIIFQCQTLKGQGQSLIFFSLILHPLLSLSGVHNSPELLETCFLKNYVRLLHIC